MRVAMILASAFLGSACDGGRDRARPPDASPGLHDAVALPDAPTDADPSVARRTAIVFAAALDGQAEPDLYAVEPDGSQLVRLTNTAGAELYPSWSPDHTRIAFVRDFELFTIDANGRHETRVASRVGKQRLINGQPYSTTLGAAAWSPDGVYIAYPGQRPTNVVETDTELVDQSYGTILRVVTADGEKNHAIMNDPGYTMNSIAWAPDNTFSFSQADDCADCAGGSWYGFSALDGANYRSLYNSGPLPNGPNKHLDWSPDGSRWVYVGGLDYASYEQPDVIYTSSAFGDDRRQLAAEPGWNPRWSPDGSAVAYIAVDGIYIIDAARLTERRVLDARDIRGLDW